MSAPGWARIEAGRIAIGEPVQMGPDATGTAVPARPTEIRYADDETVMRLASEIADRNSEIMRRLGVEGRVHTVAAAEAELYRSTLAKWNAEHAADTAGRKRRSRRIPTVIGATVAALIVLAVAS